MKADIKRGLYQILCKRAFVSTRTFASGTQSGSVALTAVIQQKLRYLFFNQSADRIVLPVITHSPADVYTALCVSYGLTQCRPVSFAPGEMI